MATFFELSMFGVNFVLTMMFPKVKATKVSGWGTRVNLV